MAIPIPDSFNNIGAFPLESSMQVADIAERNGIPSNKRWRGMFTYVLSESKYYYLKDGITNSDWVEWVLTGIDPGSVDWSDITNIPSEFPPQYHMHDWSDINNTPIIPTDLSELSDNGSLLFDKEYGSLQNVPAEFPPSAHGHTWEEIAYKPTAFPPEVHTHETNDIQGLFPYVANAINDPILKWGIVDAPYGGNPIFRSVTYGNGLYVAVGDNVAMSSENGTSWTPALSLPFGAWASVTYGNGLFVAVAFSGTNRVMTSPDGITWTARIEAENNEWWGVTYGNGLFVAVARSGTNRVMTSPDGITWTARSAPASAWAALTFNNDLFVAVAQTGTNQIMTSPDGITWTGRVSPIVTAWNSVAFGNGVFVAVSANSTGQIMTSPDGITWTLINAGGQKSWQSIVFSNDLNLFVAIALKVTPYEGDGKIIMISEDGISWVFLKIPDNISYRSIAYGVITGGKPRFVAVGGSNSRSCVLASDYNSINWKNIFNTYEIISYNYTDDADAATNGIGIGDIYHTSGTLKIRIT